MRPSVSVLAPAKLNLALHVGPPEPTGMHPICSWMVTVNLFDELFVTRLEHGVLSRYAVLWHPEAKRRSEINWSIKKDLAVRAHLALEQHVGRHLPVQMRLQKRIPVGGGLGGGSSDAAAMLRAINELFELGLSLEELARIGATLGSDVPFLVRGGSAIVEGVGDRLTHHARVPELHALLAFPEAACPTGRVYARFDELQRTGTANTEASMRTARVLELAESLPVSPSMPLFNDLAAAAQHVAPQLEEDLRALSQLAERPAHVTGSGSSIFVVCDNEMHALALADAAERRLNLPAVPVSTRW